MSTEYLWLVYDLSSLFLEIIELFLLENMGLLEEYNSLSAYRLIFKVFEMS